MAEDEPELELPSLTADARALRALEVLADGYKVMWPTYVQHLDAAAQRARWQHQLFETLLGLAKLPILEVDVGRAQLRLTLGTLALGGGTLVLLLALAERLQVDEQIAALWSLSVCVVSES